MSIRVRTGLAAAVVLSAVLTSTSRAAIVANFDGGNSTMAVDGYVGAAGTGGTWTNAWTRVNTTTITTIAADSVLNGNSPTAGGGNYLNATVRGTSAATAGSGAFVGRTFDNSAAGVRTSSPFTLAFDFRADTLPGSGQYFQMHGDPSIGASGASNTWAIHATGGGAFQLLTNPTGTAVATDTLAGISFAAGVNYSILVNVLDPATRKYQVTISNGTTSRTSNVEYFRSTALDGGSSVMIGAFVPAGASDTTFNVDSLTVTAVPEPVAAVAAAAGVALLARRTHRPK